MSEPKQPLCVIAGHWNEPHWCFFCNRFVGAGDHK